MLQVPQAWQGLLEDICRAEYFQRLDALVTQAYEAGEVYPPRARLFACLEAVPPEGVRVVILGQDPYHGPGQANGLAFSVAPGVKLPPSLQNIFKELQADLQVPPPSSGDLTPWARQGVLLLNTVLTVARGRPTATGTLAGSALLTQSSTRCKPARSRWPSFSGARRRRKRRQPLQRLPHRG